MDIAVSRDGSVGAARMVGALRYAVGRFLV
jgi:hypothetical protein